MNNTWNLIGHEWAVDMLKKHVVNGTTRHAYLFSGPPGLGRHTLALRFAQALNCPMPVSAGIPCGTCRDCRQIEAMQHADFREDVEKNLHLWYAKDKGLIIMHEITNLLVAIKSKMEV